MRDLGTKMAELKFEAPLAKFEETDEWGGCDFISNQNALNDTLNLNLKDQGSAAGVGGKPDAAKLRLLEDAVRDAHVSKNGGGSGGAGSGSISPNCNTMQGGTVLDLGLSDVGLVPGEGEVLGMDKRSMAGGDNVDNFTETFGGSLEDLVNTFDEKITKCFGNYEANVEELAPVQVRSQEEIMNECQMWWTITGNFGNILPIDWSKSYTRQMHMPTLNLGQSQTKQQQQARNQQQQLLHQSHQANSHSNGLGSGSGLDAQTPGDEFNDLTSEDEAVANDLDMHALILNGLNSDLDDQPIKTVEEVIKEIDDIMDEAGSPLDEPETCESEVIEKAREVLGAPLYAEKLQYLTTTQLNELYMEMEVLIQELSETLINELALRDELEFEKELKNSFISLLLAVQNKRRQYHVEKKRGKFQGPEPKYLTTVIPYHLENGTPNNQSLQVLIKILKAINEDSPTVPALLTDYILKVLCPT
ncbi:fasciculation and elongation protein zeta-2 isoform X1 [Drosophila kikkawai]|uniref:Fasciculation and elongation protein zeta-2 isoform X1 n=1 Tax=Drosophila kikkawai TaxID=30033 RepID=A0A6P4JJM7_DROKI|nr:fasciculation and elongation protein zeta-2 [Drosophila kikkawai]